MEEDLSLCIARRNPFLITLTGVRQIPLSSRAMVAVWRCSDQPDISFDHLDHIIHLPVPYLFGNA